MYVQSLEATPKRKETSIYGQIKIWLLNQDKTTHQGYIEYQAFTPPTILLKQTYHFAH